MPRGRQTTTSKRPASDEAATLRGSRIKLAAGLFVGAGSFLSAYLTNAQFLALERGENPSAPMPVPIIDVYDMVGRHWTVAAIATFGAAFMVGGVVGWWRERGAALG